MNIQLNHIFHSLADDTRRDILKRLSRTELSVSEIADSYDMSLPAVSKHLSVLENANLISRRRNGKKFMIHTNSQELKQIDDWISYFRNFWTESFEKMDGYLTELQKGDTQIGKDAHG